MTVRQGTIGQPGLLIPGLDAETEANLVLSVLVVALVLFLRRAVLAVVYGRTDTSKLRYRWAKGSATFSFVLSVLLLVQIWFTAIRSIGSFLGLLSAGVAIALLEGHRGRPRRLGVHPMEASVRSRRSYPDRASRG